MVIGLFTTGLISVMHSWRVDFAVPLCGHVFFHWVLVDLGKYTSQGSAFLIMMILGGAIIPPFQGVFGDSITGLHKSYLVAAACFVFLAFLALKLRSVLKAQGLGF